MKAFLSIALLLVASNAFAAGYEASCEVKARLTDPFSKIERGSALEQTIAEANSGERTVTLSLPLAEVQKLRGQFASFAYRNPDSTLVRGFTAFRTRANGLYFSGAADNSVFIAGIMLCR